MGNGNILLSVESGASMQNNQFPKELDVEDLIDMNLIFADNKVTFNGLELNAFASVKLFMHNLQNPIGHANVLHVEGDPRNWRHANFRRTHRNFHNGLGRIWEGIGRCLEDNPSSNDRQQGLYVSGYAGGNAINYQCKNQDDIPANTFFFDTFATNI